MTASAVLEAVATRLEAAGIPFMLTGSFASAVHGAARATMDIDLVIDPSPEQLRAFVASLPAAHYYVSLDAALEDVIISGRGLRPPEALTAPSARQRTAATAVRNRSTSPIEL